MVAGSRGEDIIIPRAAKADGKKIAVPLIVINTLVIAYELVLG